jgi:tripartite-type tricarboxylate transporter receptor subunit TctC
MTSKYCRTMGVTSVGVTSLIALACLGTVTATRAQAIAAFPSKSIHIIVPFSPGGPVDIAARTLAQHLQAPLGQSLIVESRPGAGTIIGTDFVAKSSPDGHTWLITSSGISMNPSVYKKLPYDTLKDLAPVTLLLKTPWALVVNSNLPIKSVNDLVSHAKQNPGKLFYSSSGTANQLTSELFNTRAGIKTSHSPYKGSAQSLTAVVSGEVAFQFGNANNALRMAKAGKVRMLAVTSARRDAGMPDVPTVAESGLPGFESIVWFGVFTAGGTPTPVQQRIHSEIARIAALDAVRKVLSTVGSDIVPEGPEVFAPLFKAEVAQWAKVAREAGIQPE